MAEIKGVILAAGRGTRLRPLTDVTNKMLLPIFDRPMIMGPIEAMRGFGIRDICLVVRPEHEDSFRRLLGDGSELGVKITYEIESEARGAPITLLKTEKFCEGSKIVLLFGDNLFGMAEIPPEALTDRNAYIFLKDVKDPQRFGVAETSGNDVISIVEKPKEPRSNHAVIGLYVFPNDVFDIVRSISTGGAEMFITSVNNAYLQQKRLKALSISGYYFDTGTTESLLKASLLRALSVSPGILGGIDKEELIRELTDC